LARKTSLRKPNHDDGIISTKPRPKNVYDFLGLVYCFIWGTGIRGLMRGMANLPQGNQELLVVRDKVGRPPGEFGVSRSIECDIFPSML